MRLVAAAVLCIPLVVSAEDLGNLSANPFGPNSTSNPFSPAGNPYSPNSVRNPHGTYGSPCSNQSATNPYATQAPKLYEQDGNHRGRLSSNPYDPESISNPYGRYGNRYSPDSINNPYGAGNPYRPDSPANPLGSGWKIVPDEISTPSRPATIPGVQPYTPARPRLTTPPASSAPNPYRFEPQLPRSTWPGQSHDTPDHSSNERESPWGE